MNKALAKFLFENETLYKITEAKASISVVPESLAEPTKTATPTITPEPEKVRKLEQPSKTVTIEKQTSEETYYTKEVLIVSDKIQPPEKEFLQKILKAVNLNFEEIDFALIEDTRPLLHPKNATKKLISFGLKMDTFHPKLSFEMFSPKKIKSIEFLEAPKLSKIESNLSNEKKQLWECLQAMFK